MGAVSEVGWVRRVTVGADYFSLRILPSFVGLLIALLLLVLLPNLQVTDEWEAWVGVGLVVVATVASVAVPWKRLPPSVIVVVPLVTMAGFGLFRVGTGGASSVFSVLIVLPLIWIASLEGRVYAAIAAGAVVVVLFFPYFLGEASWGDGQVIRGVFSPLVYLAVAVIVNDLAHRARSQVADANALADERAARLAESEVAARELEQAAERARTSDAFTRSVWDAVVYEAVIVTDSTGLVIALNPGAQRMLGVDAADVEDTRYLSEFLRSPPADHSKDRPADDVLDPPEGQVFADLFAEAQRTSGSNAEWSMIGADGTRVPVQLSVSPRLDAAGETAGFIFVGTDVTQAHEVARLKDEFVGMISHELRTPLSSILGYLELIREDEEDPLNPEQLQYLEVAERNANRLLSLVGDLLFTAQVEAGRFPVDKQPVDLGTVARASVESARPGADNRAVTLIAEIPPEPVVVSGDVLRLGQACDNLLSNALKFTPAGGTVTVAVTVGGDDVVVSFADTGMGIPADEIDRLFTRFFRSSTAMRQAVQGVGLGLSITKAIVTAHGGSLGVESEQGVGTTFTMSLPIARVD